jgi:hypothetical protein
MMDDELVLSSFADGEPVDPAALSQALERDGAHDFLVDVARMRQRLRTSSDHPSSRFYDGWQRWGAQVPASGRWPRLARAGLLAASLVAAVLAGVWIGGSSRADSVAGGPPVPSRVIHLSDDQGWQPIDRSESRQP